MGRIYRYENERGSIEWEDRAKPWLIKFIMLLGWGPCSTISGIGLRNAQILRKLSKEGKKILLLPTHYSEEDTVFTPAACFAATWRVPYQIGNKDLPNFLETLGYIPIDRRKDMLSKILDDFAQGRISPEARELEKTVRGKERRLEAGLRRHLVYREIIPDFLNNGKIVAIYPQREVSYGSDIKGLDYGTLDNIVESVEIAGGEVYGVPMRLTYTNPPIRRRMGKKGKEKEVTLPPLGSRALVEIREPILINAHKNHQRNVRRFEFHLEREFGNLVGARVNNGLRYRNL